MKTRSLSVLNSAIRQARLCRAWCRILLVAALTLPGGAGAEPATNRAVLPGIVRPDTNVTGITSAYITGLAGTMRTNHPALHALRSRARAAVAAADAVRIWDDPMARLAGMGADREMRADDGDVIYGIEQKLPLFGRPQSERRMAVAEAEMEAARIELQFQTLRRDLAKTVFRAALADRAIDLALEDIAWLDTLIETVEARYRNRAATVTELTQAQNERSKRINQLRVEEAQLHHQHVALNRFTGRDSQEHWRKFALPPVASPVGFGSNLVWLAQQGEPKLKVMAQELRQSRAAEDVAQRMRYPEVAVGAQGRNYSRNGDFRSAEVMLSFSIPWGNRSRYDQQVARERARSAAVGHEIENETQALTEEIHQLTVMIANARREALLYQEEIIPRSRTALASAHSAWLAGTGMLRDVIEARRMLTEAELMSARAVAEQYQAMSDLVLCCGLGDLESLERIGVHEISKPKAKQ
jgi:outer membrane protein TolC